jgi:hypothetical protein
VTVATLQGDLTYEPPVVWDGVHDDADDLVDRWMDRVELVVSGVFVGCLLVLAVVAAGRALGWWLS